MFDFEQKERGDKSRFRCFHSFLPSKKQRNDRKLRNRMKLCSLSIFIMWASSLKTALYITSFAIDVPTILTSYNSCKSTFEVTRNEKEKFSTCVNVQVEQCESRLEVATERESERVNIASAHNSRIVKRMIDASRNCTGDYTAVRGALEAWQALEQ